MLLAVSEAAVAHEAAGRMPCSDLVETLLRVPWLSGSGVLGPVTGLCSPLRGSHSALCSRSVPFPHALASPGQFLSVGFYVIAVLLVVKRCLTVV